MHQNELKQFSDAFEAAWSLHKPITHKTISLAFDLLKDHSLANVLGALRAHCLDPVRGQFPPKPADIIYQIERRMPQRLTADEAYMLIPSDESETVVWTHEIAEAAAIAGHEPDKTARRMAFKSAYERITERNKLAGKRPSWFISYGWDMAKRERPIQDAIAIGRIKQEDVDMTMLPSQSVGIAGLLQHQAEFDEEQAKENLKSLRRMLA